MESTCVLICLLLISTTVLVVLAGPIESPTKPTFVGFYEERTKTIDGACQFPPLTVLTKEKFKSCLDNEVSGSIKNICDGIVELSDKVCPQGLHISALDVVNQLSTDQSDETVENICRSVEIQRVFIEDEICGDVCSKEKGYFPCELYLAMLRSLYNKFEGLDNLTVNHIVIHNLPSYFPFPPHGSMDNGYFLQACEKESESNSTSFLCSYIPILAKLFGERNIKVDSIAMTKNVTTVWNPCPLLTQNMRQVMPLDYCVANCMSQTMDATICRSIAFGMSKLNTTASAGTSVTAASMVTDRIPVETLSGGQLEASGGNDTNHSIAETEKALKPTVQIPETVPTSISLSSLDGKTDERPGGNKEEATIPDNATGNAEDLKPTVHKAESTKIIKEDNLKLTTTDTSSVDAALPTGSSKLDTTAVKDDKTTVKTEVKTEEVTSTAKGSPIGDQSNNTENGDDNEGGDAGEKQPDNLNNTDNGDDNEGGDVGEKQPDKPDNEYSDESTVSGGISFMSYFLVFIVLCVAGYIVFHNKQKIIALVIEGKHSSTGRRPSSKDYKQLKTDDVMPSLEKSANTSNYVY